MFRAWHFITLVVVVVGVTAVFYLMSDRQAQQSAAPAAAPAAAEAAAPAAPAEAAPADAAPAAPADAGGDPGLIPSNE
jgi:predicted lipid-binding transport protein (Tim44 family)